MGALFGLVIEGPLCTDGTEDDLAKKSIEMGSNWPFFKLKSR